MAALTQVQLKTIRQKIRALRRALDDFERALSPDSAAVQSIDQELEEFIEANVSKDELDRLSEIVPQISEIQKEQNQPSPKRRKS